MMRARRCVTSFFLVALCAASSLRAAGPTPALGATFDPAAVWRDELDHGNLEAITKTYVLEASLHAKSGGVDHDVCKAKASDLNAALDANAAGLAIWYVAYQCAQALGDAALAEQRLANFAALVRYGVESRPPDGGVTPIRIVAERDADVFVKASGQVLLYAYYDTREDNRWMPLNVALWDAERGRERLLAFDYLDTTVRLLRGVPYAEFPMFRRILAQRLIEPASNPSSTSAAGAARALAQALDQTDVRSRFAALESLARDGNFGATMTYEFGCIAGRPQGCEKTGIDLMLPWAERKVGMVLVALAFAYEKGFGVERDRRKAATLIEAAERRLGVEKAHALFFSVSMSGEHEGELNELESDLLARDVASKMPVAEYLTANRELIVSKDKRIGSSSIALLRHAANAGLPQAQGFLGEYLCLSGQCEEGNRFLLTAAESNDAPSQRSLAKNYENGVGVERDIESARRWYSEAGTSGDAAAMVWMGQFYKRQNDTRREAGWFGSAARVGSLDGALELASLYVSGGDGVEGTQTQAAALYRVLDRDYDSKVARRALATLLATSDKLPHDLGEARRLLTLDADRGDDASRFELGRLLIHGAFGEDHKAEGRRMLSDAAAKGSINAMIELGWALYYGDPPERRAGLDIWLRAADAGNAIATNNVAWALCTSPQEDLRDPARGLASAKISGGHDPVPLAYKDTLATCYAASGDFATAERILDRAIEVASAHPAGLEDFITNASNQREMFRKHQVYIETNTH
jgi:TPR repeat protein